MVTVIPCVRLFLSVRPSGRIDGSIFFSNIYKVLSFLCSSEKVVSSASRCGRHSHGNCHPLCSSVSVCTSICVD